METGAHPNYLIFEVTETAAVQDINRVVKFVSAMNGLGCRFALDDFGVGFTSFLYLQQMQVDYIKIDGAFVRRMNKEVNNYSPPIKGGEINDSLSPCGRGSEPAPE